VIGRDAEVRRALFHHLDDRIEHASDRAEWWVGFTEAPDAVEVAKEFVGSVNEVNDHDLEGVRFSVKTDTLTAAATEAQMIAV